MSSTTSNGSRRSASPQRILLDRCISSSFAPVLRKSGLECVSLAEVFGNAVAEKMKDEEWIQWAAENDYAVLTVNPRILKVPVEREAILQFGAQIFCIANAQTTREDRAYLIGRHILSIMRKVRSKKTCFWRLYMGSPIRYDI